MINRLKKEDARELLKRYRLGKCTEREVEIIDRWYQSYDVAGEEKAGISHTDNFDPVRVQMLGDITRKINQAEADKDFRTGPDRGNRVRKMDTLNFKNLIKIAAVILVGTGLGVFFFAQNHEVINKSKTLTEEVRTKKVLPSTIYLSDGSVVWLKGESRLEYPETFEGNTREVTLIGEAFFDVAKDQAKPFIIHSTHFTTRVLGTSFNIKAYEKDESQEVVVITGKVIVSTKEASGKKVKELVLRPNQKATYSKRDNSFLESDAVEHEIYTSLAECKLVFDEASLESIIKVLNTTYRVNVSLAKESMKNCIITADLTNETLEVSIATLSKAINAEYTINGKDIILRGDGCPEPPKHD